VETKLARIAEAAKARLSEKFTSLAHLINERTLAERHRKMETGKASGVDGETKATYGENLEANLQDLVARMKRQAYKPQPALRKYIPKPGTDKMRPLGLPSYEDKLVQGVLAEILGAIYEQDFLDCSHGFRPGRGCHEALRQLGEIIETRRVNYILDADIRGFFDHVDHEWLMKFVAHRVADPNVLRLIQRFLMAGVMEAGIVYDTPEGTPQGGVISPLLANVYLHYVLDLWFEKAVKRACRGEAYMVRYADDFVCCFQYEDDAKAFYGWLKERLKKFELEIAEEKTRIIAFGRQAWRGHNNGGGKPETFDFLGFTHYCGTSRGGWFRVKRKTSRKKYRASIKRVYDWLAKNRHLPMRVMMRTLRLKVAGNHRYYGITDNLPMLRKFNYQVRKALYKWLNRRSQRRSLNWEQLDKFLRAFPLPKPVIHVNIYRAKAAFATK
jgi:group II intron reverse transcriptase/maturase